MRPWGRTRARALRSKLSELSRTAMKQLNVWPLLMLLIAILFIVYWLRPH
jgi:hypothetical protein